MSNTNEKWKPLDDLKGQLTAGTLAQAEEVRKFCDENNLADSVTASMRADGGLTLTVKYDGRELTLGISKSGAEGSTFTVGGSTKTPASAAKSALKHLFKPNLL